MELQLKCKYSRLRMFLLVSVLVGVTLCLLQHLGFFYQVDSLLLAFSPERDYTPLPTLVMMLVIMFHTMLPGIVILEEGVVKGIAYSVVVWFFYGVLLHSYTSSYTFQMPLTAPLLGCVVSIIRVLAWEYTFLQEEKDGIRKTFGCFVEPKVADIILNNPDLFKQDGQRTVATVMFADLRGFTGLCERIAPEQVIAVLRDCFGKLISIVRANGGTVDKLIGDSMMVVWGNPVPMANHAEKAVEAAIEMQVVMQGLQQKWQQKLGVEIMLGIGITTDEVVAGTIGSEEFCDYTVLGSGVNRAFSLESICPGGKIYVSEQTQNLLRHSYSFKKIAPVTIKDNCSQLTAYQVLSYRQQQGEAQSPCIVTETCPA